MLVTEQTLRKQTWTVRTVVVCHWRGENEVELAWLGLISGSRVGRIVECLCLFVCCLLCGNFSSTVSLVTHFHSIFRFALGGCGGSVLIDDRDKLRADWEKAGGIFIYHTNTASTVQQLRSLGIVPPSEESAPTPSLSLSSSDPPSGAASTAPVRETAFNAGTVETNKEER